MPCFDVTHYHFTEWSDHGVPSDKMCMIEFIGHIRKAHSPGRALLVVHCSSLVQIKFVFTLELFFLESLFYLTGCHCDDNTCNFKSQYNKVSILIFELYL